MFQSLKYSNLAIRLSLAAVFLWLGIDKFFQPEYWFNAWVPQGMVSFWTGIGLRPMDIIYISAGFEILVAVSLITNIFVNFFSWVSILYLVFTMFFYGISEVTAKDLGLIGALLSLVFWPKNRKFF